MLTNASGFAGIDGVFRFRPDGTNERGLAVMRVTPNGGQIVSPAPKTFPAGDVTVYSRQIGHHRVEHRKARQRDAQAAVGRGFDRAFLAQDRDALGIERAAGQRGVARADRCLRRAAGPSAGIRPPSRRPSAFRRR